MADESRVHAAIPVELFFERKDHQGFIHVLAQKLHPSLPPCPELRTDVVHDRNAASPHPPGHSPVEARGVDDDREVRPPLVGRANQTLIEAENLRKMAEDFSDADNREVLGVDDNIAARGAHALPTGAEESKLCGGGALPRLWMSAQRFDELRAIHVSGGFPGGDEDLHAAIVREAPEPSFFAPLFSS